MSVRVADYIAEYLARAGLDTVFLVTGGGAMHLNDGFTRHPGLQCFFNHHEQGCAIAAEGYARVTRRPAIVNVTTGPGGTNAISGVFGAWTDSIPMIVISGQVKRATMARYCDLVPRQLGDQEVDIIPLVDSITKYAALVSEPESIRYHLDRALHEATSGRPGPVWLDVPIDVQSARVDPARIDAAIVARGEAEQPDSMAVDAILAAIAEAERPVILPGTGVWAADQRDNLLSLAEGWRIPVATAWNAHDLVPNDHPCHAGRPGTVGDRAGNFVVQSADLILILGCRLNIRQISYNWRQFGRAARKIMVDIDAAELRKPTLDIDLSIEADLRQLMPALAAGAAEREAPDFSTWLAWCRERVVANPVMRASFRERETPINPYVLMDMLSPRLADDEVIVCANATAAVVAFQVIELRAGQRLFSNSGSASMGYDLPAALGACVARGGCRVLCLAGDGSIMMNLQELQTIANYRLPVKILLLNNNGYLSIRQTQTAYFSDNLSGFDAGSGVGLPDFQRLMAGFDLPFRRCDRHAGLGDAIEWLLATDGPGVCEFILDPEQGFEPKLASKMLSDGRMSTPPLEDMHPFMSRDELAHNLMISPLDESE